MNKWQRPGQVERHRDGSLPPLSLCKNQHAHINLGRKSHDQLPAPWLLSLPAPKPGRDCLVLADTFSDLLNKNTDMQASSNGITSCSLLTGWDSVVETEWLSGYLRPQTRMGLTWGHELHKERTLPPRKRAVAMSMRRGRCTHAQPGQHIGWDFSTAEGSSSNRRPHAS